MKIKYLKTLHIDDRIRVAIYVQTRPYKNERMFERKNKMRELMLPSFQNEGDMSDVVWTKRVNFFFQKNNGQCVGFGRENLSPCFNF